ncbi:MAG: endonuclease/exonuclease/phosphatase family protein [Anaerolineaceae bacterium]|nr:endonuclease/exonuclease/phosphatase family protein [Anaerolineaceae bacterium]
MLNHRPIRNRIHKLLMIGVIASLLAACNQDAGQQAAPQDIALLTHNLHAETQVLQPFVEIIRESGADIVALQEVSPEAEALFAAELGDTYPHRAAALAGGRYNGQIILSRYPILEETAWYPERRLLRAVIDVNGVPVTVYNAHPASPGNTQMNTAERSADITFLLEQAAAETNPTLLMGDFNSEPWSEDYNRVAAAFGDAFAAVGEGAGLTYPDYSQPQARVNARLPAFTPLVIRLDYIFYDESFAALAAQVGESSGGSDHRPVGATLRLEAAP